MPDNDSDREEPLSILVAIIHKVILNISWMSEVIIHYLEKVMARSQQKAAASIKARDLVFLREGENHYNFLQQQKATNLKMI